MLILLLKSLQPGLFEKLVPVAGSVSASGRVTAPHTAIRHVKPREAPKPKHHAPEVQDLFAERAAAPEPARVEAAKPPEPPRAPKSKAEPRLGALKQRRDPESRGDPAMDMVEARVASAPAPAGGLDYSAGLPATIPEFGVHPGVSKADRRALNTRAAAMVSDRDALFDPAREPTDPAILRQYSGWGGCGDSLNEFYTDTRVAAAMWAVLHRLGVGEGANVLEPSCGTGVFMATAPAGVKVTGVELDGTSSKIASELHSGHEIHNSSLEAFATTDARQFDAVIGNPPFGDSRGRLLAADKPDIKRPEQYFIDTALDKCRPGGVVAFIVPTGIMDSSTGRKLRNRLIRKGQFLGAMRMPNTAFEASHTGVTADVVFFRKRSDDVAAALSVVDVDTLKVLGAWDDEFVGGGYFAGRGADNILGVMGEGWRAKAGMGDDITVEGSMVGVPEAIAEFAPDPVADGPRSVMDVLAAVSGDDVKARVRGAAAKKPYDQAKRGDTRVVEGVTYVLDGEPLRWHRVDEFMAEMGVIAAGELGTEIERAVQDDGYAVASGLAEKVKAYVEAHGVPSKNPNLIIAAKQDKAIYRLIGAVKPDGSLSDVVTGRKVAPVESSFDAAAQTLALEVGQFTPSMVAGRWHAGTEEAVLDHLYASPDYALDPLSGTWTSLDNYLTGDLWPKLDAAKAALVEDAAAPADRAKYERQAIALEAEIDPKSLEDVEVMLSSGFVPLPVVAAFFNEKERHGNYRPEPLAITYDEGYYAVVGGPYEAHILRKYLNRDGVRKDDDLPTIERWNREFKEWLCASAYRDQVEEEYNRKFRGFRQRAYSEVPMEIPGLVADGLKAYQWPGLRWALEAGKGIIAADVGLGKTVRALILNKLMKASGQARRPMIVVPKSVAANWLREADRWFPGSSVMVIGETYSRNKKGELTGRADNEAERNRKFHDIRQNEYDFIIITQPAWNALDLEPETKQRYQDDDFWEKRKRSMGKKPSLKEQAKQRAAFDAKLAGQDFQRRSDALYFNDLGVDAIISDEMHAYKNLFAARDRFGQSPKFLGGSSNSKRAADMRYKTNWLRDQTGGKNVYGLTATPTKNSPLEVYSMLSHIAPEAFDRIGIRNSEDFLDRFCTFEDRNILDTTGRMTRALCVTGFKNMGELREIMRRYIDRKTAADVGLELPARDDQQHLVDISAEQKEVYADLRKLADDAKSSGNTASGEAHPFAIMSQMDKATLDLSLVDPVRYANARSPKMEACAEKVMDGLKDGGQIIFCDSIGSHDKFVRLLEERGVPRDQIGVMNAQVADTSAKRQNIAEAYRAGKLRVVLGNSTMEEGVDGLQSGTVDIHHLNIPWTPATIQQRNGRGLRQGNTSEAIRIHNYLGKATFDGYRHQTITAKKDWQDLLWNGGDKVENLAFEGGMNHEEMLIALAEDSDTARAELAKNKGLAQAKLDAEQHTSAAEDFASYRKMRATLAKLDAGAREKPSGQRLEFRVGKLRTALEANSHFKPKHALDAKHDVLIQPQTGEAFEPGSAFEVGAEGKITAGRYVVEAVHPTHGLVQVRRWGETGRDGKLSIELDSLAHAVTPVEHDAKAEEAHITAKTAETLAASAGSLTGYKQLRELPAAAIEANHDVIRRVVKEGMRSHRFGSDRGYNNKVGVIAPDGSATALESYESSKIGDDHEPMLPIDAHRKLAFSAYATDERQKKFVNEAVTGRRGAYTGQTRQALQYPGNRSYDKEAKNRWAGVIGDLWGPEGVAQAHREWETGQLETARRAPTFGEAVTHALPTSVKRPAEYASPAKSQWGRKALATLYAKARYTGSLDDKFADHLEMRDPPRSVYGSPQPPRPVLSEDHFDGVNLQAPVRTGLRRLASAGGHNDLAAAMALDHENPDDAHAAVNALPDTPHRADALKYLAAKHPQLGIDLKEAPVAA